MPKSPSGKLKEWPKHFTLKLSQEKSQHDTFKRECLSPQVFFKPGLVLCTDIMQYVSSKVQGRSQRRHFRPPCSSFHNPCSHQNMHFANGRFRNLCHCEHLGFCIGTPQELKEKWGNGGKLHPYMKSEESINQHPRTTVSVKRIYAGGQE